MLSSLIRQLCVDAKLPLELQRLYDGSKGQRSPSQTDLLKILCSMLTQSQRTFIILDALDECAVEDDRKDLFKAIEEMMHSSSIHLNMLVTSRKETYLEEKFNDLFNNIIALGEDNVSRDIAVHIQKRLEIDEKLKMLENDMKKDIKKELCKKADGM